MFVICACWGGHPKKEEDLIELQRERKQDGK
jgi:hypothetical protein